MRLQGSIHLKPVIIHILHKHTISNWTKRQSNAIYRENK